MIKPGNDGVVQNRESLTNGFSWVVKKGIQIRIRCKTKASHALLCTIQNHEGTIRECRHAWHHTLARHTLQRPSGIFYLWGNRDTVIEGDGGSYGRSTTDHNSNWLCVRCRLRHDHRSALQGIRPSAKEVVHG